MTTENYQSPANASRYRVRLRNLL